MIGRSLRFEGFGLNTVHLRANCSGDFPIADHRDTVATAPAFVEPSSVYQHATVRAIKEGRLSDPVPAMLTRRGTAVAIGKSMGLTDQMRRFIRKNYMPAGDGRLRVAGRSLLFYEEGGRLAARAPVMISGDYVVLEGDKVLRQTRVQQPGWHDVDLGGEPGPASLFWKPAWDAGFKPLQESVNESEFIC